jgi:hypothetical protein
VRFRDTATDRKSRIADVCNGRIQSFLPAPGDDHLCAVGAARHCCFVQVVLDARTSIATMVSVVDSSIADKAAASLEEIFSRLELPMRDRNGTKVGSPGPVQEDADKSVNDLRALVTPDTAGEIGITLGALKVRGREIYGVAIRRGSTSRADQIVIDEPV